MDFPRPSVRSNPRYALACFISLLFLSFISDSALAKEDSLVFGVISSLNMPFAETEQKDGGMVAKRGLLIGMADQLAKELGRTPVNKVISRSLVVSSLMNGSVDVVCYTTPQWMGIPATNVKWSDSFVENNDILISRAGVAEILVMDDMSGKTIGTVKHYNYPLLEPLFNSGKVTRLDSSSEKANFMQLLKASKIEAITLNELTFTYLYNKYFDPEKFPIVQHSLIMEFVQPQCAISRHSDVTASAFNVALNKLKAVGFIDNYLKKVQ